MSAAARLQSPGADEGVVRLHRRPTPLSGGRIETPASDPFLIRDSQVRGASAVAPNTQAAPITHDASPRVGAPHGPACPCPLCRPNATAVLIPGPGVVAWDPTQYPDEYLCDGGARAAPFHYEGRAFGGLDTEDTIGEAYDITGKRLVEPSSQVCIYAPRFGALRTFSGTHLAQDAKRAAGTHEGERAGGVDTHLAIVQETQRDQLLQYDMRSRASGIEAGSRDSGLHQSSTPVIDQQQVAAYQNLVFLQEGQIRQSDLAVLAYGVQLAGVWTRDEFPVIAARDIHGHEIEVEFNAHEFAAAEKKGPGLLRVVKLADKETARPGDVVTFTIRFDNLGETELLDVRLTDNLTPRLEYVSGSATSELPGGLDIEPNGEGSSLLRFRLDAPLPGHTGGVITFQCRVR